MGMHKPVLLNESVAALAVKPDGCYIDATYGRGGHTAAILSALNKEGRLIIIDQDPDAIEHARAQYTNDTRVTIHRGSFGDLSTIAEQYHVLGGVDGILLDLGVSSPQLDQAERGFSFQKDGPLDMRMNSEQGVTASEWVASVPERELITVLKEYGEERYARRIAQAIVRAREASPITRTKQLADIIAKAHPAWQRHRHPATRSFQAIRIAVNHEMEALKDCLADSIKVLSPGGRLAVISFHGLENRIVRKFIQRQVKGDEYPPDLPIRHDQLNQTMRWIIKKQLPSEEEIASNARARSAALQVAERLS